MDEFKALLRQQVVPSLKKSGATDYGVVMARLGTPSNEKLSLVNGRADLDGPRTRSTVIAGEF